MGFFAILRTDDSPQDFVIEDCHINLWSLSGIFGGRCFLWDIGLRITAGAAPLSSIRVALPAGSASGGVTDLAQKLTNQGTAELIFGKPVTLNGDTVDYGKGYTEILAIDSAGSKLEEENSTDDFSVWTIKLAKPISVSTSAYLRFRINATKIGRCWTWRSSLLERKRIIIDFRLCDIRELWYLKNRNSLKHAIHTIQSLNFFVIIPARFRLAADGPPAYYSRILEGYAWRSYLQRLPSFFVKEKLIIHQWRNKEPVNLDTPLRIFADLDDPRVLHFGPNLLFGLDLLPEISTSPNWSLLVI
jgi:hypothetical protein